MCCVPLSGGEAHAVDSDHSPSLSIGLVPRSQTAGCTMERKGYSLALFGVLLVCFSGALRPASGKGTTVE